ncbi:MAG: hypothetical protein ACI8RZ_003814 [Myxococcota bacterium]|jgi:hypothetical protein
MKDLAAQLSALLSTGGSRNRLTISSGDFWLALSGEKGGHAVTCEAVTNDHLPSGIKLTAEQRQALLTAGFTPIKHSSRVSRIYGLDGATRPAEVAELLTGLLQATYGVTEWSLTTASSSTFEASNPLVIQQMRKLSRTRDHQDRMELYRRLLRATLLVPVESEGGLKPAVIGELVGFEVFGAFTDLKSVLYHDPRGVPLRAVSGRELFPMLVNLRAGSLRLNPGAVVGGELYRNELESIAGAVMRVTLR